ncbi:TPT-domain-containing protein [Calocera cornea HHB12733]|uniref:TPT-domain-containing protein n=1 Tax=Calocera cornea HHB12733 TaxID=1353952 RepID=A0A165HN38_9BASI|nr:TPT-domain-containing protein [Calocera cornea HHB12733]
MDQPALSATPPKHPLTNAIHPAVPHPAQATSVAASLTAAATAAPSTPPNKPQRHRVTYTYTPSHRPLAENQEMPYSNGYANGNAGRGWKASDGLLEGDYEGGVRWADQSAWMQKISALWQKYTGTPFRPPRLQLPSMSLKFVVLCALWYTSSAMASNTAKPLLNLYRYPVTLTILQFGFVAAYCAIFFSPIWKLTTLRSPTKAILKSTIPMALFQVGGHIFSSMAISRVPVSTVHTIKALSPLFTVGAYAFVFGVTYSPRTYLSLVPLTVGVMLACTFDMSASSAWGLLCAFGSTLVVVSSNIFFKKIMPSKPTNAPHLPGPSHKLDKLNLLFYTSSLAFAMMVPLWLYSDVSRLWVDLTTVDESKPENRMSSAAYYLFLNCTVHFAQNLIAFALLSITSPVTYSIASLVKRIAVICIAILYFNQSVHPIQAAGILLAGVGLWMYNNAKGDIEKGEKRAQRVAAAGDLQLPTSREEISKSEDERTDARPRPAPLFDEARLRSVSTSVPQGPPLTARGTGFNLAKPAALNIPSYGGYANGADIYPSPPDSRDSPPMKAAVPLDGALVNTLAPPMDLLGKGGINDLANYSRATAAVH